VLIIHLCFIGSPLFVLLVGGLQLLPRTSDGNEEGSANKRKMLIEKKKIVKKYEDYFSIPIFY
jgi:hypothetical protein